MFFRGDYSYFYNAITAIDVTVSGQTYSLVSNGNTVNNYIEVDHGNQVSPGVFRDLFNVRGEAGSPSGVIIQANLFFESDGSSPPTGPITGLGLPGAPFDPSLFQFARMDLTATTPASRLLGLQDDIQAQVLNFTVTPVPEPATVWLMLSGVGALAGVIRRRSNASRTPAG